MVPSEKLRRSTNRNGFTLTEMAIVLSLTGMVLSGIWIAASRVYQSLIAEDLTKQLVFASGHLQILASTVVASASDETLTDSCGATPPCSTNLLVKAGVFQSDFVDTNQYVSGASTGNGSLFQTKYGYTIWTGIENGEIYAAQAGDCPASGCPSAPTVLEIDLFGLTPPLCTSLLMKLMNGHLGNLNSVTTTAEGWGPLTSAYGGSPSLPATISASTAAEACAPGAGGEYSYDTSTGSQIWVWFTPG